MALVRCPECGNGVSDQAETCPSCAFPLADGAATQSYEGQNHAIEPGPSRRTRLPVLLAVAALIATPFAPAFPFWCGIGLVALCAATCVPAVQDFSRYLLGLSPNEARRSGLRVIMYGLAGVALIIASQMGVASRTLLEEAASEEAAASAKRVAEQAEQRRMTNEPNAKVTALVAEAETAWQEGNTLWAKNKLNWAGKVPGASNLDLVRQLHTRMANARVVSLVKEAEEAWREGNAAWMEKKLHSASKVEKATDFDPIRRLRVRMANAKVEALVADAVDAIEASDISAAREKFQAAIVVPYADALADANKLVQQIDNATDPSFIRTTLMKISNSAFKKLQKRGNMPKELVFGHKGLDSLAVALAKSQLADIGDAREQRKQKRLKRKREARRKREEEQRLAAEAGRQARERRMAEARRQVEERERRTIPLVVESWRWHIEHGYAIVEGEVTNRSDSRLENVEVVVSFYTSDGKLITSDDALIKYNPILPGQTSPFKTIATYNPQMKSARLAFKHLFGGLIEYKKR